MIPEDKLKELRQGLTKAECEKVLKIIDEFKLSPNLIINEKRGTDIFFHAVQCRVSSFKGSEDQIKLVNELIERGADPNVKTIDGYNALHVAVSNKRLAKIALQIVKGCSIEVNATAAPHQNSVLFLAIGEYGQCWQKEAESEKRVFFEIIQKLLDLGADLNQENKNGYITLEKAKDLEDEDLMDLIEKYK
ncbi:MAG: hypothetical protein GQ574_07275 [Crocinitomix sp.]|nr:hypothetical protein [Crocinitomix sp.]